MLNNENPRPEMDRTGAKETTNTQGSDTLSPMTFAELDSILARVAASRPDWQATAAEFIDVLAATGRPFQAADVTAAGCPAPEHPNQWGAAFRAAHTRGVIVPAGTALASRRSRRRALVRLWQGVDVAGEVAA